MFKVQNAVKINNQTILQEQFDDNYEPTEDEVREYALYIGIDLDHEVDLLWLAREGMMKPLPSGWKPCQEENGELYYFNFDTGTSSWEHPYDEIYRARVIEERGKKLALASLPAAHAKDSSVNSTSNESRANVAGDDVLSRSINSGSNEHSIDLQCMNVESDEPVVDDTREQWQEDLHHEERLQLANLAAQAAERRLQAAKADNLLIEHQSPVRTNQEWDLVKLQRRLEQSGNDEKLQLLEDNRVYMEQVKRELDMAKEQEERALRDKMKVILTSIENRLQENLVKDKKLLETRHKHELNGIRQALEREKQELQAKLRADMVCDLNLEQQKHNNIRILSMQLKQDYDEKLSEIEGQHKNELDHLTQRYERITKEKYLLEKRFKEKDDLCATLRRMMEHLCADKTSLKRQLREAKAELKAVNDSHRESSLSSIRKASVDQTDNDRSTTELTAHSERNTLHRDDVDDEELSETDSDVVQMKQTLQELQQNQRQPIGMISSVKSPTVDIKRKTYASHGAIDLLNRSSNMDDGSFSQNLMSDKTPTLSFVDSGRWTNTMGSGLASRTYPLSMQPSLHYYGSSRSMGGSCQFQSSLITREAVLKAARDLLPPGVIDQLSSNSATSKYG